MTKNEYVEYLAGIVIPLCKKYNIKYPSAVIAHACNEGAFGTSGLASKYHNLFGIKNSASWKGKAVNMKTKEEYSKGNLTSITAGFRWYDSDTESIEDYLKLVTGKYYTGRCHLEQATSPEDYLNRLMPVYCTSTTQANTCAKIIATYGLNRFDNAKGDINMSSQKTEGKTGQKVPLTGVVTASALNVRLNAGLNYPLVCVIKNGERVTLTDVKNLSDTDVWYGVITENGKTGWCKGKYIKVDGA